MPRRDDEFDDDRPRRRPDDDDFDDRPRRRRRFDDDDDLPPRQPKKKSNLGLILGILAGVLFLFCAGGGVALWYAISKVGDAADRMTSSNNMKEIAIGCHNYHDVNNGFPTDSYSPDGKPLLSWRVHILPYVGEDQLYRQFRLDEPWDSPNNIRLLNQMPMVYATPDEGKGKVAKGSKTFYRGFTNRGALFERRDGGQAFGPPPGFGPQAGVGPQGPQPGFGQPGRVPLPPRGVSMAMISDGTSNTILAVEAADPTEWTKPGDLDASPGKPFPALGGIRPKADVVMAVLVDGSTRAIRKDLPEAQWRAMTTYAGGEIVDFGQ